MTSINYQELCLKTCDIARKAGAFMSHERKNFDDNMIESKGLHDLVSYVDKASEKLIIKELTAIMPESGFIAEEGTTIKHNERYNWVIDPLDGTTNYIHGIPIYAVSIALMEYDEIVIGVVYEVGNDECFYAWKDGGAFLNDKKIEVSKRKTIQEGLLATGFPYNAYNGIDSYMKFLEWTMKNARGVRRLGSAATDLAYVACGRFDAFWEYDLKAWDVAAGALIVIEAGGVVSDYKGENNYIFGKEIIAANNALYTLVLNKIESFENKTL